MSWMLLWKGKGTNPSLSPEGSFIGYERGGGVVLESTVRKVEVYRNPQGMDPQWWSEDEFAFRKSGETYFYTYHVGEDQVQRMHPAPGAVFLCNNRHWCSWEKKSKKLWVDGVVQKVVEHPPVYLDRIGEVYESWPPPPTSTVPDELVVAEKIDWVQTKGGFLVYAFELPGKKLKVFVEEPDI